MNYDTTFEDYTMLTGKPFTHAALPNNNLAALTAFKLELSKADIQFHVDFIELLT